jgi:transposase
LAATLLSTLHTMRLWGLNPRTWLQAYLQACAHASGKPPDDIDRFLPWRMQPAQLTAMGQPPTIAAAAATPQDTP